MAAVGQRAVPAVAALLEHPLGLGQVLAQRLVRGTATAHGPRRARFDAAGPRWLAP
jgi:hypothetical protein